MASATDFREVVLDYLAHSIDRRVFTKRFAELFYNIEKSGDQKAIDLSYAIEFHLAEAICGMVTEDSLRTALSECITGWDFNVCIFKEFRGDDSAFCVREDESSSPFAGIATFQGIPA